MENLWDYLDWVSKDREDELRLVALDYIRGDTFWDEVNDRTEHRTEEQTKDMWKYIKKEMDNRQKSINELVEQIKEDWLNSYQQEILYKILQFVK